MGFFDFLKQAAQNASKPACRKCLNRAANYTRAAEALKRAIDAYEEALTECFKITRENEAFTKQLFPSVEDINLAEAKARVAELTGQTERDIQAFILTGTKGLKDLEQQIKKAAEGFKTRAPLCPERFYSKD